MANTAENLDLILLDLHAPAAAITLLTAPELVIDLIDIDRQPGGQAFDNRDQRATVGGERDVADDVAEAAIEMGSCRIINVKVGRVGGFSSAIAVHNTCKQRGIPVWCGGMLESGIGRAHNVALSTLENFTLPGDVSASKRYWKEDIIEPEVTISKAGTIKVSDQIGTGYKVREDVIESLSSRKLTVRANAAQA